MSETFLGVLSPSKWKSIPVKKMLSDTDSKDAVYWCRCFIATARNLLRSKEDVYGRVERQPLELHTNECSCFAFHLLKPLRRNALVAFEGLAFSKAYFAMKRLRSSRIVCKRWCSIKQLCYVWMKRLVIDVLMNDAFNVEQEWMLVNLMRDTWILLRGCCERVCCTLF